MAGGREHVIMGAVDHKHASLSLSLRASEPMLHNLIGTLCVDVDFLGTNCNKKTLFNTASKHGAKVCPFFFFVRKLYKNYKNKNTKKPQEILK